MLSHVWKSPKGKGETESFTEGRGSWEHRREHKHAWVCVYVCGPFSKCLLNSLHDCFCLCFGFRAMRQGMGDPGSETRDRTCTLH